MKEQTIKMENNFKDIIKVVKEISQIQKDNTQSHDEYMVGLYNGLELALSYMEEREPIYIKVTKK